MKKFALILIAFCFFKSPDAQKISYVFYAPNIVHHEAQISLIASDIPAGPATFRMSRSSPGRYATHEFGKNVYDVKAYDKSDKQVSIQKIDGDVYRVPSQNGFVKVVYTLFGDYADGTYVGIDKSSIHLNMPATFMWMKGMDNAPIEIKFDLPKDNKWTIATQLTPTDDPNTFTAPGLQYMMDSPVKIGQLWMKSWEEQNPDGKKYHFRLALEAESNDSTVSAFTEKVKKIVAEEKEVYGEFPNYDYGSYTFLASLNKYVHGDGMEHRNSTMISTGINFNGQDFLLGVFSHEFFHCWNVERIRPKSLEPFNFEKSNMSSELWMAEGFTQYYGSMLLVRAGFTAQNDFSRTLASLINIKMNTPGAQRFSPVDNSREAVFTDAGVAVDKTNYQNMFTSYYPYGASVALALEFELRMKFNLTLDDFMKAAWKKFGKTETPYAVADVEKTLEELTGDKKFAADFFKKYVTGHEPYDYAPGLEKAGYIVSQPDLSKAWIGNTRFTDKDGLTVASPAIWGTPLYNAGLDEDDVILEADGKAISKQSELKEIIESHKPGDVIQIKFSHRNFEQTTSLTFAGNPMYSVKAFEDAGMEVTGAIKDFREKWLGSKVKYE